VLVLLAGLLVVLAVLVSALLKLVQQMPLLSAVTVAVQVLAMV
jgi:hypothetical protein